MQAKTRHRLSQMFEREIRTAGDIRPSDLDALLDSAYGEALDIRVMAAEMRGAKTVAELRGAGHRVPPDTNEAITFGHLDSHMSFLVCSRCSAAIPWTETDRLAHTQWHRRPDSEATRVAREAAREDTTVVGPCPNDSCEVGVVRYTNPDDTRVACDSCSWEGWDEEIIGSPRTGETEVAEANGGAVVATDGTTVVTREGATLVMPWSVRPIGWWHPSVRSGRIHDHDPVPVLESKHKLCQQVAVIEEAGS